MGEQAGFVDQYESSARSLTNRMDFQLQRRLTKITFIGRYSLGWMKTDAGGLPADNYNLASEWGRASGDYRHRAFIATFMNLPKGFRLNMTLNATSGAPFNITTGFDENRDGTINDRPAGIINGVPLVLGRDANLTPDFYALPVFNRMICVPGTRTQKVGDAIQCINNNGALVPQETLRQFLNDVYPNGVIAQGPGNLTVTTSLSKTFGFGKRNDSGLQAQGNQGGDSGDGNQTAGGRTGGRGAGGGRGGGGGGGGGRGGGGGGGGRGGGGGLGGGGFGGGGFGGGREDSRFTLTFTLNATNPFNRVNFGPYSGRLGSQYFGISNNALPPRQMEFNVRFGF
jgi:hypothetical protein